MPIFFNQKLSNLGDRKEDFKMRKVSILQLIKENKEELLKDKHQLEIIEKRIDQKYINQNKSGGK
jgi:Fur-regulated basic protein B